MLNNKFFKATLIVLYIVFFVFYSYKITRNTNTGGDFHVFWEAGNDFINHNDLYTASEGALSFIYPQFAAFIFQILAFFSLPDAAWFFYCLNILFLIPLCAWLLYNVCINYGVENKKAKISVAIAFALSAQYLWNNLSMLQVNQLLFTFTLTGIWFLSKDKPHIGIMFFTMATFIKIVPVFFLLFTLLYYRSVRLYFFAAAATIFCLLAPSMQRGIEGTVTDYTKYYEVFLSEFKNGKVLTAPASHTLKAGVLKMFYPETRDEVFEKENYKTALTASNYILLGLFAFLTLAVIKSSGKNEKISMLILAAIFIFSHLASGMTWTHHLVTATFSLLPFVLIDYTKLSSGFKKLYKAGYVVLGFMAIEGSDTTGRTLYIFFRHYDIYVIVPMLLLVVYIVIELTGKRNFGLQNQEPDSLVR